MVLGGGGNLIYSTKKDKKSSYFCFIHKLIIGNEIKRGQEGVENIVGINN